MNNKTGIIFFASLLLIAGIFTLISFKNEFRTKTYKDDSYHFIKSLSTGLILLLVGLLIILGTIFEFIPIHL